VHFHWYGIKSKGASVDSISVVTDDSSGAVENMLGFTTIDMISSLTLVVHQRFQYVTRKLVIHLMSIPGIMKRKLK
jgi:hypothetical protein